jgi:myo-inositol-1-phosphate synthase
MQIKINFLCRDSILAAPLVLDLVLFLDLAKRCGMKGIGMAELLFQEPDARPGPLPGTRPVYSVDEAQEHPALSAR